MESLDIHTTTSDNYVSDTESNSDSDVEYQQQCTNYSATTQNNDNINEVIDESTEVINEDTNKNTSDVEQHVIENIVEPVTEPIKIELEENENVIKITTEIEEHNKLYEKMFETKLELLNKELEMVSQIVSSEKQLCDLINERLNIKENVLLIAQKRIKIEESIRHAISDRLETEKKLLSKAYEILNKEIELKNTIAINVATDNNTKPIDTFSLKSNDVNEIDDEINNIVLSINDADTNNYNVPSVSSEKYDYTSIINHIENLDEKQQTENVNNNVELLSTSVNNVGLLSTPLVVQQLNSSISEQSLIKNKYINSLRRKI